MNKKKKQDDEFIDKIGLANLLNLDEVAAEEEAREKKRKSNQDEK